MVFALFAFLFTPLTFAGGGLIEPINIQGPNGASFANPGEAYTLTFRVDLNNDSGSYSPSNWCKQCPAKIVFLNPQDGDKVNPLSDKTDDNGEITAKVSSGVPLVRYAHAIVTLPDGTVYEGSQVFLNFTGKLLFYPESNNSIYNLPSNSTPTPTPTPTPAQGSSVGINVWILSQQIPDAGSNSRNVVIKWSAFDGNPGTFTIYGRLASNKNWDKLLDGQKGPSATVNIKAEDYYIKVYGCQDKWGNCVDSNILFFPKVSAIKPTPSPTIKPTVSPTPNSDKKVDELNKKVENLQNQLEQSKKTQGVLEQRVNDLVNFIKKLFPFFK